jgi:MEMO1 family protein
LTAAPAILNFGIFSKGRPVSEIRPAAVAGTFYPARAAELARQVGALLDSAACEPAAAAPKAVIVPHAGYIYSGPVAAAAYARLSPLRGRVARVVLLGPSHHVGFRGLAAGSAAAWRTPLGDVPIDRDAVAALVGSGRAGVLDAAHAREHALEVQVPFLQQALGSFRLLPIVAGNAPPEAVAGLLDAVWGGPETLVVISSDLSHYLDYDTCRDTDDRTAAAIERLDETALGPEDACGCVGVSGMLLAAKRRGLAIARLDLRNSGDTAGPRDRVVGYGSWAFFEPPVRRAGLDQRDLAAIGPVLVDVACAAIASGLVTGEPRGVALPPGLHPALAAPGAVFVTLQRGGALRGCIGSPLARRPLLADTADNAFNAAFRDPRFAPLKAAELDGLGLSISLLSAPLPLRFADEDDLLAQLRPGEDGLIIEDGGRRALFLPAVWRSLPERRGFLAHLKQKAGLAAGHWSPGFRASRFHTSEIKSSPPDLLHALLGLVARLTAGDGALRLRPPAG